MPTTATPAAPAITILGEGSGDFVIEYATPRSTAIYAIQYDPHEGGFLVEKIGADADESGPYFTTHHTCTCRGSACRRHSIVCRHRLMIREIETPIPTPGEFEMARKKATPETPTPAAPAAPKRTRSSKPASDTPVSETLSPALPETTATPHPREQELTEKYPHQAIVTGSYRVAGGREGWGHKHTVQIICQYPDCTATRVLATSDLQWPTSCYCPEHSKIIKSNRRATKKTKDELK